LKEVKKTPLLARRGGLIFFNFFNPFNLLNLHQI
jgi:hypothetical protein